MPFILFLSAEEAEKLTKTKWAQFFETPCIIGIINQEGDALGRYRPNIATTINGVQLKNSGKFKETY
jgi:hypothetical protein